MVFAQRRDLVPAEPENLDVKIFRVINNSQCGFLNTVIPITDKSVLFTSTLVSTVMFGISRSNKSYYDENSSVLMGLSEVMTTGVVFGVKNLVNRKRPFESLKEVNYDNSKFLLDRYSFPSGHTAMAFSMATSLTLRYPDKPLLISGMYLYSSIIALGRIYLGVHYPTDVLAGMLIGSGSAAIIYSLRKEIIKGKNSLFRESGREDANSENISTGMILTSFIISDAINYLLGKIKMGGRISFDIRGNESRANINYSF